MICEQLENRRLFWSASEDGSVLTINGDNTSENFHIHIMADNEVRLIHSAISYTFWENKLSLILRTYDGNDTINLHRNDAAICDVEIGSGFGDDQIFTTGKGIDIFASSGDDYIESTDNQHGYIYGGRDNDIILVDGNFSAGFVFGNHGHDDIDAYGVTSITDTTTLEEYKPYLHTGTQGYENDPLEGGGGTIVGSNYADIMMGSYGWDQHHGNGGDDFSDISDGENSDQFYGGSGDDWSFGDPSDSSDAENHFFV